MFQTEQCSPLHALVAGREGAGMEGSVREGSGES